MFECLCFIAYVPPPPLLNQDMTIVKTHNDKLMKLNDSNLVV